MVKNNLSPLQQYVHLSRYARYKDDLKRRETWEESVKRYCDFFKGRFGDKFPYDMCYNAILNMEVMPSMRALMTAGPALDRDEMAGYNCSYTPIESLRDFDEILYILMCGTGVGFSVERQYIGKLPELPESFHESETVIVVHDSKVGWASALRELLSLLYSGKIPKWDLSKLRPAGARLKTFGGRASGPGPLDDLFRFAVRLITGAAGRKLSSLEVHDLVCKIADAVVVGGVRRSALLSLSNLTDARMQGAKQGQWWEANGQRALANNSVAYTEKPDIGIFMKEWLNLYESKSGERGVFNRKGMEEKVKSLGTREPGHDWGVNPCAEIILRPRGLCNLTEVVARATDSPEDLARKIEIATILGTFQSTLTNFRYVRKIWKTNAEEERLLGVSITGIMDCTWLTLAKGQELGWLRTLAHNVNREWAKKLEIPKSAAVTTIKPSGTVSQLVDSASGIHPRYAEHYLRTVRTDKKDPLAAFMREVGVKVEDDITKPEHTDVFYFACKSPVDAFTRKDYSALDQLGAYLRFLNYWSDHNVSVTIYVKEDEWLQVGSWVYEHFDKIGGVSFLPYDSGIYRQAPYQEITEEEYKQFVMPEIDWSKLVEETDETIGSQELACIGGVCEVL